MADKSGKEFKKEEASGRNLPSRKKKYDHPEKTNPYIEGMLFLQQTAGNQAVQRIMHSDLPNKDPDPAELISRASSDPWHKLDDSVRNPIEQASGVDLGNVKVHSGPASNAAAESIGARAYTTGSNIYLGADVSVGNGQEKRRTLAHEAVHTIQQGGSESVMQPKMHVSQPGDRAETEADQIAQTITNNNETIAPSQALSLRDSLRGTMGISGVAACIQRDIKGKKKQPYGEFEINFKKNDAKVAGGTANEDGEIKFTPAATAPESDSIRFVQIARTVDTSTGKNYDWTGSPEAARNKIMTTRDNPKNIAPGFFLDQIHAGRAPRANKSDAAVLPYYDVTSPGTIGKRRGKTIVPATLQDTPSYSGALKFNLVTSAKASDTGTWYGTVLWGFETYLDKGIAKIKNEYHSFREWRGETTDAALKKFDEYYRNPGSSTAPTK